MLTVASICFSVTASEVEHHSAHVWPQSDPVTGMHFKICPFITYRAVRFFSTWRNASYFWKVYFIFDTLVSKLCGLPSLASQWQFDEQNFSVLTFSSLLLCDLLTRYFCSPFKKSLSPSKLWRSHLLLLSGRPIISSNCLFVVFWLSLRDFLVLSLRISINFIWLVLRSFSWASAVLEYSGLWW